MPKKWDFVTNANVNPLTGRPRSEDTLNPFAVNEQTGQQDYLNANPDYSWFQFDPQGGYNTTAAQTQAKNAGKDQFGLPVAPATPLGTQTIRPTAQTMNAGVVVNQANAAGRGVSAQQYFQDAVQNFGMHASQSDPTSLQPLVNYMRNEGYNVEIAPPSSGGYVKGIMLDGHFVKLLDGYNNWMWGYDDNLQQQGGDGGPGPTSFSGGGGMDVGATLDKAIADLIANGGQTGMGKEVGQVLMDIIRGGHAPELSKQLVGAREAEAGAMRSQVNDARGIMADRGLLSEPGVPQGSEENMIERLTQNLALPYSQAVGDIETSTLNNALTLATGMSQDQASNILSAVGTGTNRTVALAGIALQALANDRDWQKFLSTFGLTQTQVMEQLRQGRVDQVIRLAELFGKDAAVASGGYIQ